MANMETQKLVFQVAWRNVRRNWRHSLAALLTMAVGFVALALFQGYLDEFKNSQLQLIYARNMIGDVLVRKPRAGTHDARINPHKYHLNDVEQAFLEQWLKQNAAHVKTRVRSVVAMGMANAGGTAANFIAFGHDVPEGRLARRHWAWNAWAGHPIKDDEKTGVLLGAGLGMLLGCEAALDDATIMDPHTGTPIPVERPFTCKQSTLNLTAASGQGRMNALEAEVVGITRANIREFDQRMMWAPLAFTQELAGTTGVSAYHILLNNPADAVTWRAQLSQAAQQAGLDLQVMDWRDSEQAELFRRGMDLLGVFRTLMVVVILVIAGAAVLTTMTKTVRERTREVGTLRSLGYRAHHLLAMFALEAGMLALHAGAVGLLASILVTLAINNAGITYKAGVLAESIPLHVGYSAATYGWGFFFLSLVAVGAALVAARHVTRLRIAVALQES